ncbi:hypothetical protein [Microbacterium marinilacus]|uniref:FAD-binding FR-type domain-containing protein n=1 Tax=Microbacterium marinilacus TaxID=415209 RepID=A0ABP7BQ35_9MICO|nr:hypothetical protein [Microbacterium marinilacus]MBY0690474.1 hypothetical protein [Microbacterium marinilacus]
MPKAPAVIGNIIHSTLGRTGIVQDITKPAPGFIELAIDAAPPSGGWQRGHELQIRVTPTESRRYNVTTIDPSVPSHIRVLAALDAGGPGTRLLERLQTGQRIQLLAGPHQPLKLHGNRRLAVGDASALGTFDSYIGDGSHHVVVEVHEEAIAALEVRWPRYVFFPATARPGDAIQDWLRSGPAGIDGIDAGLLLGHAQSIQRQRALLVERYGIHRRSITTKPYWSTGKEGL